MKKIIGLILVLIVLGMGGYGWYLTKANKSIIAEPLKKVTLKLNWTHASEFAGDYVAIEKGFYKNEGLDVKIEEFSPTGDTPIDTLVAGEADFVIAGADEIIKARAAGKPIKAIAVIFKKNPAVAFALKTSGITKPQDFVGKTVGLEKGSNVPNLYVAMMNRLKIDRSKIKEVEIGYDAKELMNGTVDVSTGWLTNEPLLAREAGYPINTILMADYGANMYADTIVTTDRLIAEDPQLVTRFVRATLNGWQYTIEHESEAVDITKRYAVNTTLTHLTSSLSASIPLISTNERLGSMKLAEWEQAQNILVDQKLVTKKININDVYTMKFLKEAYK